MNRRCIGKFYLSKDIVEAEIDGTGELLKLLMSMMIIVDCDYDYVSGIFKYTAYSSLFDELEDGEVIPEYKFTISIKKDTVEPISITADRSHK